MAPGHRGAAAGATPSPSLSQVTPAQIMGYEVEAKHAGRDFHVVASLASTDALSSSLVYHQAVTPQARPARARARPLRLAHRDTPPLPLHRPCR